MNITFIPGLTFDEQIAAWMNGTEDEYRMARWVVDAKMKAADARKAYQAGYSDGYNIGKTDGYDARVAEEAAR